MFSTVVPHRLDRSMDGDISFPSRVGAVRVERNQLELDEATGAQRAIGSGVKEVIECGMVLGSIGYRCLPVQGVPYDERNSIIANER